ncbi:MAG: hypothetical protein Q8O88_02520 [bacterium]|nr:hypothetical protein [bacterium]
MNFDYLIPYIQYIIYFLLGIIALYIRTLVIEKAKINSLRKKNNILIEESEKIKSKYSKEIEEIKKGHLLDIEKRKYQYESKKEQYINFFKLLDNFNTDSNVNAQDKMIPIIEEFNRNYLNSVNRNNKKDESNAITVMSKKVQKLMLDSNKELSKIKLETNTIRIIASDSIIKTLDLLELAYDKSFEESSKMMKDLQIQVIAKDQEGIKKSQREMQVIANVIMKLKNDIIQQMRIELNEI